jgi:hypothetical protein
MLENKSIGWSALILFVVAAAMIVLPVFSPVLERYDIVNPHAAIAASGVLALVATVLGFCSFKTGQGKVGAIGGLVLLFAVAILISSTTVSRGESQGVQQAQPKVQPAEP